MENTFKFYLHGFEIFGCYNIGDDIFYIESLQSGPVWSCGCRRQRGSVFSCSRRRQSGSVLSCSRRQETPARSIFEFDECETIAREGQGKDGRNDAQFR